MYMMVHVTAALGNLRVILCNKPLVIANYFAAQGQIISGKSDQT